MSGIHIVGAAGPHEGLLRQWAANGLQLVTHVKPEPLDGRRLRSWLGEGALLVGRIYVPDQEIEQRYQANPRDAAEWMWEITLPEARRNPEYNCWQLNNEPTRKGREGMSRLAEFTRHCLDIGAEHGVGLAMFNFARGTPEPEDWPLFYETWRHGLALNQRLPPGQQNILSIHQYGSSRTSGPGSLFEEEPWHLKRFELTVRPRLPADLRAAPYVITESGADGETRQGQRAGWRMVYGMEAGEMRAFAEDWRRYNEWLARQPGCRGAACFTLHQEGGFENFDIRNTGLDSLLAAQHYPRMQSAKQEPAPPSPVEPEPPTPPVPGTGTIYEVVPGDTLGAIAHRFGTTVKALMASNGLENPNLIRVGQRLRVPELAPEPPAERTRELINVPDTIDITDAGASPGQSYWALVKVEYRDESQSGGTHHIFSMEPHDPAVQMVVSNGFQSWTVPHEKPEGEPAANFPMWGGNVYSATVEGLPSDRIEGMTMPANHHVSYYLWWERATPGGTRGLDDEAPRGQEAKGS